MGKNKKSKKSKTTITNEQRAQSLDAVAAADHSFSYVLHADRQKWVVADEAEIANITENMVAVYGADYICTKDNTIMIPA